jgi:hypothetical protein
MAQSTDLREKRVEELKREITKRGFDRHASLVKEVSELSTELQSPKLSALAGEEVIQSIIVFPPQIQRGWDYVPKQALLFTSTRVIHLLASIWPNQEPKITVVKGCALMYMRVQLLLLYGFLEIVAQGPDTLTRLEVEFNTVAWYYLSHPLRQLLLAIKADPAAQTGNAVCSPTAQRAFEQLPLKFSNGVEIYGLLPGEELEEFVFQPGIWKRQLYFFQRPVIANTLLLLTSHYVVVIQEELKVAQGWILTYIPRNHIVEMQKQAGDLYNKLIIRLKLGQQTAEHVILLANQSMDAWHDGWDKHGGQWRELPSLMHVN